jgi:APA family basic amino acid/polyamine antiporter
MAENTKSMFRTKSIESLLKQSGGKKALKKVLGAKELVLLGIGAIIGTGIFVLTGVAAANYAGPALVLSFVVSGITCTCAALCYAELAAMIPIAGSAYTFGYVGLGEIWAWLIGWDLVLEYVVATAAVAVGWSGYMCMLLSNIGIKVPAALQNPPGVLGGVMNLPAILIIVTVCLIGIKGVKESTTLNNILVVIKLTVVVLFIVLATPNVNPANWNPFFPYGFQGVFKGAAIVFFAYIGFDAVSTAAEETKDPGRDLPIGIIGSLLVCTILYIIVSALLTGLVPYLEYKNTAAPVAFALNYIGITWGSAAVSVGALCGITSVLLVCAFASSRLMFSLARDGLLPTFFSDVHPTWGTPVKSTLLVMVITCVLSGFVNISQLAEMTNIGTMAAFIVVASSVMVLRKRLPDYPRPFVMPAHTLICWIAIIFTLYLMYSLPNFTKMLFVVWITVGFVIYFAYGKSHSVMNFEGWENKGDQ